MSGLGVWCLVLVSGVWYWCLVSRGSPKGACAVGVLCMDGRRRARALMVSCVLTVAEGRVRCWCLVSGRSPKGACAVGVWCVEGRRRARALSVSGVWTVAEGRVRCRCLVAGVWGVFFPCETPVLGGVADDKNAAWGALRGRPMIPQFER